MAKVLFLLENVQLGILRVSRLDFVMSILSEMLEEDLTLILEYMKNIRARFMNEKDEEVDKQVMAYWITEYVFILCHTQRGQRSTAEYSRNHDNVIGNANVLQTAVGIWPLQTAETREDLLLNIVNTTQLEMKCLDDKNKAISHKEKRLWRMSALARYSAIA